MDTFLRLLAFLVGSAMIFFFFKSVIRVGLLNQRYVDRLAYWVGRWVWRLFQLRVALARGDRTKECEIMAWYWPSALISPGGRDSLRRRAARLVLPDRKCGSNRRLRGSLGDLFRNMGHAKSFQPILAIVRPLNAGESWICGFGAKMDFLALIITTVDRNPLAAKICFEEGVRTLAEIRASMRGTPLEPHNQPGPMHVRLDQYHAACALLSAAGAPLKPDREKTWLDFIEHHKRYEQEIAWLAATLGDPVPSWPEPGAEGAEQISR